MTDPSLEEKTLWGSWARTPAPRAHWKKKKKRYFPGRRIDSLIEFILHLEQRLPFWYRDRFMAAGFIEHWSFVQVGNAIKHGVLFCAEKRKKEDG